MVTRLCVWNSTAIKHYLFVEGVLIFVSLFKKILLRYAHVLKLIDRLNQELLALYGFPQRNVMLGKHVVVLSLQNRGLHQINFHAQVPIHCVVIFVNCLVPLVLEQQSFLVLDKRPYINILCDLHLKNSLSFACLASIFY